MTKPDRQRSLFGAADADDAPSSGAGETVGEVIETVAAESPELLLPGTADVPPPESLEGLSVWIVDAHSLIYQLFHALPEMTSPRGEPVQAAFGFARDMFAILESKKPDYLFCAFDMPGRTFRHELFADYKVNRAAMPEDLVPQVAAVRRLVSAMGIPPLGLEGYEADDVLATVARITEERNGCCVVVTADKDCRQLISDRVRLYNIRKDQYIDRAVLREEWGIEPEQVVDFQALVGDPTDNVPGVPLIGPKFARQLLEQYRTLENVLEHAGEVSGAKRKENLLACRSLAVMSRELVRLDRNVPLPIDWPAGRVSGVDRDELRALFREFGFRALADRVDTLPAKASVKSAQIEADYRLVDSEKAFAQFLDELARQKIISVDLETTSISPRQAEIVGYAVAWQGDGAYYLPVRGPAGEPRLEPGRVLERLRGVLENPDIAKIGQNLKYDMIVLRGAGVELRGVAFDTMVASYLLDAGSRNHNLDVLAKQHLGHTTTKITELIGSGKQQKRMDEVPTRQVADYAGEDALLPVHLRPILERRLREDGLEELFQGLEMPLVDVLVELEYNGIRVDTARLNELSRRYGERMEAIEQEIYTLAGRTLNIASPKQLQQVLFCELNLPVVKKTKTGPSTDAEVLEELARVHPLPERILAYRQYAKLKGTYLDALPAMVHPETGRVHASFHQAVTATGRLSSSDPNLQNIPIRTEEGREIRSAFVPGEPGWLLLAADYSQIELRVLAHFSGDAELCAAFARDEDIHARVASQVNGVALDAVTPEMRRQAKAVNFGVIYGQSPFGLAKQLGIDQREAARFIEAYFAGYPGIETFLDEVLSQCRAKGYVSTISGRRRAIDGVRPGSNRQRNLAERTAINTVVQGSAADLIKKAMIAIHGRLRRERIPARMLLQIHDELIFEVAEERLDDLAALVTEEMVAAQRLNVPLKVDLKAGPNWADAEPWG